MPRPPRPCVAEPRRTTHGLRGCMPRSPHGPSTITGGEQGVIAPLPENATGGGVRAPAARCPPVSSRRGLGGGFSKGRTTRRALVGGGARRTPLEIRGRSTLLRRGGSSYGLASRSSWLSYATNLSGVFVSPEEEELAETELLDTVCGECAPCARGDHFFGLSAMIRDMRWVAPIGPVEGGRSRVGDGYKVPVLPAKKRSVGRVAPSRRGRGLER